MAIVAAASRGLGRACAEALAAEGARVALSARNAAELQSVADQISKQSGVETLAVPGDISVAEDCRKLVDETARRWKQLDILVTNTGGPRPGTFEQLAESDFLAAVESTLLNVVRLVRHAAGHMRKQRWGRIINITSISARQPIDGLLLSNTIRPAIIGLAKTLSVELAPDNITVNNVCPGVHRTDRMEELVATRATGGKSRDEVLREMTAAIPLKRLGEPPEMAALVAFLASERAGYITGATIACDGGASRGLL